MLSKSLTINNISVLIVSVLCKGATGQEHSFSSLGVVAMD